MALVGRARISRSVLLVSLSALMLGAFVAPAPAGAAKTQSVKARPAKAATTGTLEVCKAAANGMTGRSFQFSVNGGATFPVVGGGCSGPMSAASGTATVVESATADTQVAAITANGVVSKDLSSGTVVVKVKAGSTAANETLVTYTNKALPALGLKVCKAADGSSPSLVGDLFSFTENGGTAFSVAAGTAAAPNCGPVKKFKLGTVVNVAELATAGTHVSAISVSDNRGSNVNVAAGTVSATVGAGVTVVTYTNAVNPVAQTGYVEVCKSGADQYVTGSFSFTVTASGFTANPSVLVGQCSPPIQVPAGIVTVTEAARAPYATSAISVAPKGRSVSQNLANQTATVTVPAGDSSTETTLTFTNATLTGQVKICKTLAANSTALAGKSFSFQVNAAVGEAASDTVVAGAAGTTTCVLHPEALPLGSAVSITEVGTANVQNTAVTVSPASRDTGSAPPTANLIVGTGVTTATFTNEAFGTVEVCKIAADNSTAPRTFQFSVNAGATISVKAGQCSLPISVPAGTATVQEIAPANFHLVGITAVGPTMDNRLTTAATANPATVSVPFGGVANETAVTFTNAVNTGQFKICKASPDQTLQNTVFNFTSTYTLNGTTVNGTAALEPGQCSSLSAAIPVVDANGNPIAINITETPAPTTEVSTITVANGTLVTSNIGAGTATVNVNQGVTGVTYTNVRIPLGTIQVCKIAADPPTAPQTFQFSVDGAAPISVKAGGCSAVMSVLSGPATVQEVGQPNFHLVGVTAVGPTNDNRLTSAATANPATATVVPGTGTNTTVVTFTNAVDTGQLEVCKAANPDLTGDTFTFGYTYTVNGSAVSSSVGVEPGNCSPPTTAIPVVDANGNAIPIAISETPTSGVVVAAIGVDNGNLPATDLAAGTATATVLAGLTKVTYSNALAPPTVVVCKTLQQTITPGPQFQFRVNGGVEFSVAAGQCSDPVSLPAGETLANVQEFNPTDYHLVSVAATGPSNDDRLTSAPTDNPATVVTAGGGVSNQTTVTFTDAVDTSTIDVCKQSDDPALATTDFSFSAVWSGGGQSFSLEPDNCIALSGPLVLDGSGNPSVITVTEAATTGVEVANIAVDNGVSPVVDLAAQDVSTGVGDGTTTITFTNALEPPTLVVCKAANADLGTQSFQFEVNGGTAFGVTQGNCSAAIALPAGTTSVSVQELAKTNYFFAAVAAVGPGSDNRLTTSLTANPATVTVAGGGVSNETKVTFFNGVNTFALTVCKTSAASSLAGTAFPFTISDTGPDTASFSLLPGGCATVDFPVVDPSGNPIEVTVGETEPSGVRLAEIQTTNALQSSVGSSSITFTQVAPGPVKVVFDNEPVNTGGGGGGGCAVPAVGLHTDEVPC